MQAGASRLCTSAQLGQDAEHGLGGVGDLVLLGRQALGQEGGIVLRLQDGIAPLVEAGGDNDPQGGQEDDQQQQE